MIVFRNEAISLYDCIFYVIGEAPSFVSSISDLEVELDTAIHLECQVRGTPKKITWMKDGDELTGDRFK